MNEEVIKCVPQRSLDENLISALRVIIREEIDTRVGSRISALEGEQPDLRDKLEVVLDSREFKRKMQGIVEDVMEDIDLSDAVESVLDNMDLSDRISVDDSVESALDDKLHDKVIEIINGGSFTFSAS